METITFTKREYYELLEIKEDLERILEAKKKKSPLKKAELLNGFGVLRNSIKGDSAGYVANLRKEWR